MNARILYILQHFWFYKDRPLIYRGVPVGLDNVVLFLNLPMRAGTALFWRYWTAFIGTTALPGLIRTVNPNERVVFVAGTALNWILVLWALTLLLLCCCLSGDCICRYVSTSEKDVFIARDAFLQKNPSAAGFTSAVMPENGVSLPYYKYTIKLRPFKNTDSRR